jgi:hypothetical protein
MPIVINEFEVVSEPPPAVAPAAEGAEPEPNKLPPPWTVRDVEEILDRAWQRATRVRAD